MSYLHLAKRFRTSNKIQLLVILIFATSVLKSQNLLRINDNTNTESSFSLQELVENVLVSGGCAQVDNFVSQQFGTPNDLTNKSYGYFERPNGSTFPFESGITLTSGRAVQAGNTINNVVLNNILGLTGDMDLENSLGQPNTNDATFVQFEFIPNTTEISFRYLMASEEYNMGDECTFADAFAFLLRRVGETDWQNLAVLPNGTAVSTINVRPAVNGANGNCAANNPEFFEGYNLGDTNYGGRTVVLTAMANVTPGDSYEIKLVMADQGDSQLDSAVFLEASSFNLGTELVDGNGMVVGDNYDVCTDVPFTLALNNASGNPIIIWSRDGNTIPDSELSADRTSITTTIAGTYSVEVTFGENCSVTDQVVVTAFTSPVIENMPITLEDCDNDQSGSNNIDITQNETAILGNQTGMSFSYHLSQSEAMSNTNAIQNPTAFNQTVGTSTVWVRLENDSNTDCFVTTSFDVVLFDEPMAQTINTLERCEGVNVDFNLSNDFDAQVYTDSDPVVITYHSNQNDADQNQNAIITYSAPVGISSVWVRVTNPNRDSCFNTTEIQFDVEANPNVETDLIEIDGGCLPAGTTDIRFDLTQYESEIISNPNNFTITYYTTMAAAESGTPAITDPTDHQLTMSPTTFFARVESARGCFSIKAFTIQYSVQIEDTIAGISQCDINLDAANGYPVDTEDDDLSTFNLEGLIGQINAALGTTNATISFHLSAAEAGGGANPISNPSSYQSTTDIIFARGTLNLGCIGIITFPIEVLENPTIMFSRDAPFEFCPGEDTTLEASGNYDQIQWQAPNGQIVSTTNEVILDQTGTYTITVTSSSTACETIETIEVVNSDQPIITNIVIEQDQTVTIIATSNIPPLEYSVDGGVFQGSPVYEDLEPGLHTVQVRNAIGCLSEITNFVTINIPNAFTPNGDGRNDVWQIQGLEFLEGSTIQLFDRYGKKILTHTIDSNGFNWDGNYQGRPLPTGDYWYIIQTTNTAFKYTGHVTIKNRNQ